MKYRIFIVIICFILTCFNGIAVDHESEVNLDYAQVRTVRVVRQSRGWSFHVTVRHNDQGWDHYANVWEVLDGETRAVIATRTLAHPHVNEQPFTRSLSGVILPEGKTLFIVRSACNVHGFGGVELTLEIDPNMEIREEIVVTKEAMQ